ncbi:MAB_1171c family putative transporter [Streptomyces sp. NPDC127112]|uniref:MAB_1171c family putative transporter n=1 Tax=Streptomyces sp. NPDC127112 TaxID=3345364 RepID=UPI00363363FB
MDGHHYYIPAAALGAALAVKLPSLRHGRHSPMTRSVCVLIATAGSAFFFAAPPTVARVNRLTGTPNFSAPLVYSLLCALSCASIVLISHWQGGSADAIRRFTRQMIGATVLVVVALFTLFALGDAPVEQPRELDTYYANTPFIREMISLFLIAHTTASVVATVKCWRWAREIPRGWTRWGLLALAVGYLCDLGFSLFKGVAVAAHWAGGNLDGLNTLTPVIASMAAGLTATGFLLPVAGDRLASAWRAWRAYRRMYPLWRALEEDGGRPGMKVSWWSSPELRATLRATAIADRLLELGPYFDDAYRSAVEREAHEKGCPGRSARNTAEAAMIHRALSTRAAGARGGHGAGAHGRGGVGGRQADPDDWYTVRASGAHQLADVSRAFRDFRVPGRLPVSLAVAEGP